MQQCTSRAHEPFDHKTQSYFSIAVQIDHIHQALVLHNHTTNRESSMHKKQTIPEYRCRRERHRKICSTNVQICPPMKCVPVADTYCEMKVYTITRILSSLHKAAGQASKSNPALQFDPGLR